MSINELHQQIGHVNHEDLQCMVEKGMLTRINLDMSSKAEFSETCVKSKATCVPFPRESKTEHKAYGDKVIFDVWGPAPVRSIGGSNYYLLFQDLFSHEEHVYFLKQKSEVFKTYKKYRAWLRVQRKGKVIILGSDRCGEFNSNEFNNHLKHAGTIWHLTVHDSPSSNGTVEQANWTHMDSAQAMLEESKLPKNLWAKAANYHIWICNWVPTRAITEPKTPFKMATGRKPNLSSIHLWGCRAWVKWLGVGKLKPRADECQFVGMDHESKGYRVYLAGKSWVSIERDVYFNENDMLEPEEVPIKGKNDTPTNQDCPQPSTSRITTVENAPNNPLDPATTSENVPETQMTEPPQEASAPPHQQKGRWNSLKDLQQFNSKQFGQGKCQQAPTSHNNTAITDVEEPLDVEEIIDVNELIDPKGEVLDKGGVVVDESKLAEEMETALAISEDELFLREALNGEEREVWLNAIEAELAQMENVKAWTPIIPPCDTNIIPCHYMFCHKCNETGHVVITRPDSWSKGSNNNLESTTLIPLPPPSAHPHYAFYYPLLLKKAPSFTNTMSKMPT